MGKYIDTAVRKDQYSCARICVEVDLEIGLHEAINLNVADWSHTQELDYEQIPFKCRFCHGYGHFARNCKKKAENEKNQWIQIQKSGPPNQKNGKDGKVKNGVQVDGNAHKSNKFDALAKDSAILEESEMHESVILEEGEIHDAEEKILEDE